MALAGDPQGAVFGRAGRGHVPGRDRPDLGDLIKPTWAARMAVMLVEHDMEVVMKISHHIIVLHQGGVIARGTPREIAANQEVKDAYLGGDDWAPLTNV